MEDLTKKMCVACEGGTTPFSIIEANVLLKQVPGWSLLSDNVHIARLFTFDDFKKAVKFVNDIAELAEREGHHPDILVHAYKNVTVTLTTHAIRGLSENDFIMAAKINQCVVGSE